MIAAAAWYIAATLAVEAAASPSAGSTPPTSELAFAWDAPPGCPTGEAVLDLVRGRIERPLTTTGQAEVSVAGTIRPSEGLHRLHLVVGSRSGTTTRDLTDPSCAVLAATVALITAEAMDELLPPRAEPTTVEPAQAAAPIRCPAASPPAPACPAPRRPTVDLRWSGWIAAGGGPQFGGPGSVAGVAEVAGGAARRWVRLAASLLWAPPRDIRRDGRAVASITSWSAALDGCVEPPGHAVSVALCPGLEAGGLRGIGRNLVQPMVATQAVFGARLSAGVRFSLSPTVAIGLWSAGIVPIVRPGFHVQTLGRVYRTPAAQLRLLVRLEVRLAGTSAPPRAGRARHREKN